MRRGRDILTLSVRLDLKHKEILMYLIEKYAKPPFNKETRRLSNRFRSMLEGIDDRAFEHVHDPDPTPEEDPEDQTPENKEMYDCWRDITEEG